MVSLRKIDTYFFIEWVPCASVLHLLCAMWQIAEPVASTLCIRNSFARVYVVVNNFYLFSMFVIPRYVMSSNSFSSSQCYASLRLYHIRLNWRNMGESPCADRHMRPKSANVFDRFCSPIQLERIYEIWKMYTFCPTNVTFTFNISNRECGTVPQVIAC